MQEAHMWYVIPAVATTIDAWWLATLVICLSPAAFILLWVIVAWCFFSDHPASDFS
jgi:hypothetical protein